MDNVPQSAFGPLYGFRFSLFVSSHRAIGCFYLCLRHAVRIVYQHIRQESIRKFIHIRAIAFRALKPV